MSAQSPTVRTAARVENAWSPVVYIFSSGALPLAAAVRITGQIMVQGGHFMIQVTPASGWQRIHGLIRKSRQIDSTIALGGNKL